MKSFSALGVSTLLLALSGMIGQSWGRSSAAAPERVILIVIDTLRRDALSCYGSESPTPNIDALAARGTRFSNAVAAFHQTTMSMGAMFTGRTPSIEAGLMRRAGQWNGRTWCGLIRFARADGRDRCVPLGLPTLASALRAADYYTIGVTSNSLLFDPAGFRRGFDRWIEVPPRPAPPSHPLPDSVQRPGRHLAAEGWRVNSAVERALSRRRSDRLFLYVHYMDAHEYLANAISYEQGVQLADEAVGQLLELLEARDLLSGARVILTSDHGEMLGEFGKFEHYGNPSFEPVLRVPLIVSPPIARDPDASVRGQDLFGLIAELAGAQGPGPDVLGPEELFLTEQRWRTYRKDGFKLHVDRRSGETRLSDLSSPDAERAVDLADHPELVRDYLARTRELAKALAPRQAPETRLTDEDRARLRALGYVGGDAGPVTPKRNDSR